MLRIDQAQRRSQHQAIAGQQATPLRGCLPLNKASVTNANDDGQDTLESSNEPTMLATPLTRGQ